MKHSKPNGTPHGSAGVCLTTSGDIVIVKIKGVEYWEFPAGRPEGEESWKETLIREVSEEACSTVLEAKLRGFCKTRNESEGTIRVRSFWKAIVRVDDWNPTHEIESRLIIEPKMSLAYLSEVHKPITVRAMIEAGALDASDFGGLYPSSPHW
jgi:ADP-ribose pyrophosphatase YjhB (NUDIX family)